jgi:predicted enzyme related to lactoylglutathione lyase
MDYQIQVVTVPVTDVDQAAAFYTHQAGFALDVDYHPAGDFRVVQLTPPGSACSVQLGTGLTDAAPGSARGTYLAVTDIEAAWQELTDRGVKVSAIRHKSPVDDWKGGWQPGPIRNAATTPASLTSPTRTATRGSSRRSATAGRLAFGGFRGEQATVERLGHRGGAVADTELRVDVQQVGLDRGGVAMIVDRCTPGSGCSDPW